MGTHDDILEEASNLDTDDVEEIQDYIDDRIEEEGIDDELDAQVSNLIGDDD